MASGQNIAVSAIVLFGLVAVIMFMKQNKLSTEEYTLVQACRLGQQSQVVDAKECDFFEEHFMEWDTQVPCYPGFKVNEYSWTPRMMMSALEGNSNMTWLDAVAFVRTPICEAMKADSDLATFLQRRREGRLEKRELFLSAGFWASMLVPSLWPYFIIIILTTAFRNYKACSGALALASLTGAPDRAQCAVYNPPGPENWKQPYKCKRYHKKGPGGWWYRYNLGTYYYLNRGCNVHDDCLVQNRYWSDARNACDPELDKASKKCQDDRNSWWKSSYCRDSGMYSDYVNVVMGFCPNCDSCYWSEDEGPCPDPDAATTITLTPVSSFWG